ncbi:MAG: molybdopterin-dependent oxidoreductase [Chloroflexota bacterium]
MNIKARLVLVSLLVLVLAGACRPSFTPLPGEVEAKEYLGTRLTPIANQNNNALKGTQYIDKDTYRLVVDGLVENTLILSYADLLSLPMESRLVKFNCVEGWTFTAKWTGPTLASILDKAGLKAGANTMIFHTTDASGYTSLDLQYIYDNNIIIALKLNDVTLPADRGFPFQVVAESKFGYKWAKWVDHIEISSEENFRGYWESRGYSNNADINGPAWDYPLYPFE